MDEQPGSLSDSRGPDGIVRNTTFAFAVQVTVSVFSAVLALFLIRKLGPDGYGIFTLAVAIGILFALLAELGVSPSAARFVAEHRGDREEAASIMAAALRIKLALATLVSLALFVAAGPIADLYDTPDLVWPLRIIAIAVFGQSVSALLGGFFIAQGRISVNLRLALASGSVELGTSVVLVLLGAGATGAACGRAAGWLVAAVLGLVFTIRYVGRRAVALRADHGGRTRQIARYAGALAIVDGAMVLFDQIDALLIAAFLGASSVGLFQAPMRLTTLLLYPGYAVANGVAPRLARERGETPDSGAFQVAFRVILLFQAALIAPVLVWAQPIADLLFGDEFAKSAEVLRWLAPFVFLSGLAALVSLGANYLGLARRRVPIAIAAVLVNIVVDLALIPTVGVIGAAIGTSLAYTIYVPGHVWLCWRWLDLELPDTVLSVIRALAAAVTMGAVLFLFGTDELSLWDWLGGAAAGTATYVTTLVLTGELSRADVQILRRVLPRRSAQ